MLGRRGGHGSREGFVILGLFRLEKLILLFSLLLLLIRYFVHLHSFLMRVELNL